MPGGDRTGPLGQGPMTGRGAGFCAGFSSPGFSAPRYGRGFGRGMGQGRGLGRRFWYRSLYNPFDEVASIENEKQYLEDLVKNLETEIETIKDRLEKISKEKKE